jgi:chaperone BCS1
MPALGALDDGPWGALCCLQVAAQEGRLLFMTTNHIEVLNPALIRPGRVDVRQEFRLASGQQARQLFLSFYQDLQQLKQLHQPAAAAAAGGGNSPAGAAAAAAGEESTAMKQDVAAAGSSAAGSSAAGSQAGAGQGVEQAQGAGHQGTSGSSTSSKQHDAATAHGAADGGTAVADSAEQVQQLEQLANTFASSIPQCTVSMAQLQGYLMAYKYDPQGAVDNVARLASVCSASDRSLPRKG